VCVCVCVCCNDAQTVQNYINSLRSDLELVRKCISRNAILQEQRRQAAPEESVCTYLDSGYSLRAAPGESDAEWESHSLQRGNGRIEDVFSSLRQDLFGIGPQNPVDRSCSEDSEEGEDSQPSVCMAEHLRRIVDQHKERFARDSAKWERMRGKAASGNARS